MPSVGERKGFSDHERSPAGGVGGAGNVAIRKVVATSETDSPRCSQPNQMPQLDADQKRLERWSTCVWSLCPG